MWISREEGEAMSYLRYKTCPHCHKNLELLRKRCTYCKKFFFSIDLRKSLCSEECKREAILQSKRNHWNTVYGKGKR